MQKTLTASLITLFLLAAATVKAQQGKDLINPQAKVSFSDTVVEFGLITMQDSLVRHVTFKNTGKVPLQFYDGVSECGCGRVLLPRKAVKPGKKGRLTIVFKSPYLGSIEKKITLVSNAGISYLSYRAYVRE